MIVAPHIDQTSPRSPTPQTTGTPSAIAVPTERQSLNGVEVIHTSSALTPNYTNMPHARIYHPKQAPSAILSENFLAARAILNPGFVNNIAQTNIARVSNLYKDVPRFESVLDILV